jgi:hypothetical protein
MANTVPVLYRQDLLEGAFNILTVNVNAVLWDLADDTLQATDHFLSDVASAARVATLGTSYLSGKHSNGPDSVHPGVFAADPITFASATGDQSEALALYRDTGTATTSNLIYYIDDVVSGLPVTPVGTNITVTWDAQGIFAL